MSKDLFAPITKEEKQMFAAPTPEELEAGGQQDMFAPITAEERELFKPMSPEERKQPTQLGAFGRGIAQGATFGFSDEIVGLAESLFTDKSYEQARDESRAANLLAQEAFPKTMLAGELAGGLASVVLPGGVIARGAGMVATGAASGALAGLGYSEADTAKGTAKDVAIGTAFGLGAGLVGKGVQKIYQKASSSVSKGMPANNKTVFNKFLSDNQEDVVTKALRMKDDITDTMPIIRSTAKVGDDILEEAVSMPTDFINYVSGKDVGTKVSRSDYKKFVDAWSSQDKVLQSSQWDDYLMDKAFKQATSEFISENAEKLVGVKDPGKTLLSYFKDPMIRGIEVDGFFGTDVGGALHGIQEGMHRSQAASAVWVNRLGDLRKQANKSLGKNYEKRITHLLNANDLPTTEGEREVLKAFRSFYNDFREDAAQYGMNINYLDNYSPRSITNNVEIVRRLNKQWDTIQKSGGLQPSNPKHSGFIDAITWISPNKVEPKSAGEITNLIKGMLSRTPSELEGVMDITTLLSRKGGGIPDLLLEEDAFVAAMKYVGNTYRGHFLRPALSKLKTQQSTLKALGADKSAAWLDKVSRRIRGEPSGGMAHIESGINEFQAAMNSIIDKEGTSWLGKQLASLAKDIPDLGAFTMAQVYPNLLGWRVDAPLRNMTQTLTTTMPEIGADGAKYVAKGWNKSLPGMLKAEEFLISKGIVGGQYTGEAARRALQDGLYRGYGTGVARTTLDKVGQAAMKFYGMSDTANRYITYHIGQELGEGILQGKATSFVKRMPRPIKAKWDNMIKDGQVGEAKDMLSKYLIDKTQFDYTKAGLSEFGQDFGKFASTLTKWPMMIWSDAAMLAKYGEGMEKVTKPMLKYGTPFALAVAGNKFFEEMEMTNDPVKKILLGSSLTTWAPASSMFLQRPFIAEQSFEGISALNSFAKGDWDNSKKSIIKTIKPFVPGVVPYERWEKILNELSE